MKKIIYIVLFLSLLLNCSKKGLAQSQGLLYGMTNVGGTQNNGTLFSYDPVSNKDSVLVNFTSALGAYPYGYLIQASNGMLYGMLNSDGAAQGTLFSYNVITGKDSVLINFKLPNGRYPFGSLIQATNGLLYGTTTEGGTSDSGALFSYDPISGKDTVLLNFHDTIGTYPSGALLQAADGKLYGMCQFGGKLKQGVIYRFDPVSKTDTVLIHLDYNNYGANPAYEASLMQDTNKLIYGMTNTGGSNTYGILFSYNTITGKDTTLITFSIGNGAYPHGKLLLANNGLLYGMTNTSSSSYGLMFSYNTITNKDSIVVNFNTVNGASPYGTPIQAANGLLYGMTRFGGLSNSGALFSYDPVTGKDTALVNFNNSTGYNPYGDLLEAMSGTETNKDSLACATDSSGWANVRVRGGKMPLSYSWSTGATIDSVSGLGGGNYICKVTDARGICLTFNVTIFAPASISSGSSFSNMCFGDSNGVARVNASGGTPPYTYKWNTGAPMDSIWGLKPGKDTCLITDANGCTTSAFFNITQALPFKIDSVTSTPASCPTCFDGIATVYVSGGVPPGDSVIYYYSWTYGGDSATVKGLPTGYDAVCVTSAYYKCGSACDSTLVLTGLTPVNAPSNNVSIYPVPSNGQFSISLTGAGFEALSITDEVGREIYNTDLDKNKSACILHPNLSPETAGIYFVKLYSIKGLITKKLVIQK